MCIAVATQIMYINFFIVSSHFLAKRTSWMPVVIFPIFHWTYCYFFFLIESLQSDLSLLVFLLLVNLTHTVLPRLQFYHPAFPFYLTKSFILFLCSVKPIEVSITVLQFSPAIVNWNLVLSRWKTFHILPSITILWIREKELGLFVDMCPECHCCFLEFDGKSHGHIEMFESYNV